MTHLDLTGRYRPTLLNTLRAMVQMNVAIWRDYRDCVRIARRRRLASRHATSYALPTVSSETRTAVAAVYMTMATAAISVVCLGISAADAWPWVFGLLGVA